MEEKSLSDQLNEALSVYKYDPFPQTLEIESDEYKAFKEKYPNDYWKRVFVPQWRIDRRKNVNKMETKDWVDKFTVYEDRDIKPYFDLEKELKHERNHECFAPFFFKEDQCQNKPECGFFKHVRYLKSDGWIKVQYCEDCKRINVIYHTADQHDNFINVSVYKIKE